MIREKPLKGSLDDTAYGQSQGIGCLSQLCLVDHGDGTHEVDGQVVTVVVLHVTDEELSEAVEEETMDFGMRTMMLAEL